MPGPSAQQVSASTKSGNTELRTHTAFFDKDGDGVIWPKDTYMGFRALGYSIFISLFATLVINGAFSYATNPSWIPDPFFRLWVLNMHKAKHGSDSESYDKKGTFDEARFEETFQLYTDSPHDTMTFGQAMTMVRGNADFFDPFGWTAGFLEWQATYLLLWPADGKMRKDDIKGVYDGSVFWKIEEDVAKSKSKNS